MRVNLRTGLFLVPPPIGGVWCLVDGRTCRVGATWEGGVVCANVEAVVTASDFARSLPLLPPSPPLLPPPLLAKRVSILSPRASSAVTAFRVLFGSRLSKSVSLRAPMVGGF